MTDDRTAPRTRRPAGEPLLVPVDRQRSEVPRRPPGGDRPGGRWLWVVIGVSVLVVAAAVAFLLGRSDDGGAVASDASETTVSEAADPDVAVTPPVSTEQAIASPPATAPPQTTISSTSTSTSTSTTTTTVPATETRLLGYSVQGRPIEAFRSGTPGGVPVLAVGVIHGDEAGGLRITELMRDLDVPDGVELWIIDSVNPDGVAAVTRGNANGVDLNRNADGGSWDSVGEGTDRYSGPFAASEPETQAVQAFLDEVRPQFSVWWHQVGNHVDDNDSVADYGLLLQYAELVGLPVQGTSCVTACVGTISGYLNDKLGSTAFVVELPAEYGDETSWSHATAFLTVAGELAAR